MKLGRVIWAIVLGLGWWCVFAPPGFAQPESLGEEQEVIVRGLGAIIGGDVSKAHDDALANALRTAVEQVLGTMVESEVLVKNYQVVEDQIYSRTRGYVSRYEILEENRRPDNILELRVRAWVRKSNLKEDLQAIGLLLRQKGKPRLMVAIEEKNMDSPWVFWTLDLSTTENAVMKVFLEKGFQFVDRKQILQKIRKEEALALIDGDVETARQIARETPAEVLIVGKALAKPASGGPAVLKQSGMVSCQAIVNLRAIRADDGRVLATASQQSAAVHVDQLTGGTMALQRAAEQAARELMQKILERWREDVYTHNTVQLRLLGVENYQELVKIKGLISSLVRGVEGIVQRDYVNGSVLLELTVKSTAARVADELVQKDFSPYRFEIVTISQNTIVAKVKQNLNQGGEQ